MPASVMQMFADQSQMPPAPGDIIEGTVLSLDRARLYVDLPPFGTGIIYGREYMNAREVIKRTNIGDKAINIRLIAAAFCPNKRLTSR